MKPRIIAPIVLALHSIALNVILFVYGLNLVAAVVKINSGFVSSTAVMLMLPLGAGALIFSIYLIETYRKLESMQKLKRLFFQVTAVQACLLAASVLIRIIIYRPLLQAAQSALVDFLRISDYAILLGGLGAGTIAAVLAVRNRKNIPRYEK